MPLNKQGAGSAIMAAANERTRRTDNVLARHWPCKTAKRITKNKKQAAQQDDNFSVSFSSHFRQPLLIFKAHERNLRFEN